MWVLGKLHCNGVYGPARLVAWARVVRCSTCCQGSPARPGLCPAPRCSVFGEDALVNVSVEKLPDGRLGGYLRIRWAGREQEIRGEGAAGQVALHPHGFAGWVAVLNVQPTAQPTALFY